LFDLNLQRLLLKMERATKLPPLFILLTFCVEDSVCPSVARGLTWGIREF